MAQDNRKKKTNEDSNWEKVRHTATRTEVQTAADTAVQELFQQAEKPDPALIVIQGDMIGRVFRIKEGRNIIGRHPNCAITVHQRAVSGFHAEITRSEKGVILQDLQSTNGTVHNKQKIARPVALRPGDLVKVGGSVFKYVESKLDAAFTENLHQQVTRDPMTGVYNKGYALKALSSSMEIAKAGYPLSVIMFDLDHFKKINDTHGHLAGDFILKEVCRVLIDSVVRVEDVLGRFGGEEFMVIMPDCAIEAAESVAERIRKTLEGHDFDFEGKKIPVTASIGVCSWVPSFKTPEDMIAIADQLLYKSKQAGRNRVSSQKL
jgi:diguanylate cyclase (GGDEF)-like protein